MSAGNWKKSGERENVQSGHNPKGPMLKNEDKRIKNWVMEQDAKIK
jgi:hypothetical protein